MQSLILSYSAVLGLIIGSFINCLAWRLHEKESLGGRSHCRSCQAIIKWYDNIPVLSFLLLRARCRKCQTKISWQYPVVEAVTGLLFFVMAWRLSAQFGAFELWHAREWLTLARDWFLIGVFTVIFIMDARWYIILDKVSLPAAGFVLIINLLLGMGWQNLLISATIGIGFFLIQFLVSRGRWIGGGDIRLGLLLGVSFSWPALVAAIFLGYCLGSIVGLALLASGKKSWGSALPLGTFLSFAAIIILLYGDVLINWYLGFIHLR